MAGSLGPTFRRGALYWWSTHLYIQFLAFYLPMYSSSSNKAVYCMYAVSFSYLAQL